jgi:5,10-methylenetetrahydrofolate reductase
VNERILKFAEAAGWDIAEIMKIQNAQKMQKFAELIVQECVQTLRNRYMGDNNREDMEVRRCIEDVKEHFGVK